MSLWEWNLGIFDETTTAVHGAAHFFGWSCGFITSNEDHVFLFRYVLARLTSRWRRKCAPTRQASDAYLDL